MKRLLALLLALTMVFALAACGGDEAPAESAAPAESGAPAESAAPAEGGEEGSNVLRVAMECAYAPYNWTQGDDSNGAVPISGSNEFANGYDVMIAKKITDTLGMELEIVKLEWDAIVPAIQAGSVDVGICGQSITSERLEMVDFSAPYYYASIVAVTTADGEYAGATSVADLAGGTTTSQLNTIWYDICLPQIPDAEILPGQDTAPAMLVALTSGRVDYIVTDQPTGLAAVTADSSLVLLDFSGTDGAFEVSDEEINIGISIQKGRDELTSSINSVLETMTADDYTALMNDAIAVQPLSQ